MTTANKINRLECLIKTTECKLQGLTDKITIYKKELDELSSNKLEEPMRFKDKVFYYKNDLDKFKKTKEYKLQQEPYFRCPICNVPIFDGVWELKHLLKNTNQLLNSNWRKHREVCNTSCKKCGVVFHSRYAKENHKCGVKDFKELTNRGMNKEQYQQFKEHKKCKELYTQQKEQSPTPEPVSSPEPIKCEISEISSSDEEYESWQHNYRNYYVGNKSKRIIDEYDEPIGYLYQNRLIQSDDDLYEDFKDSLKEI